MRVRVIAVGQRLPAWIETGCEEYVKRMPREWNFDLVSLKGVTRVEGKPAAEAMRAEAKQIEAAIPDGFWRIALDERGKQATTAELAGYLRAWRQDGRDVALIIGGADGLDPALKEGAQQVLALSALTLPHGLARLLLVEQLYRASSLLQGHPYHRV
ncbi:MAG: 23S rRNA (pseudouridine(1915)-N(3))-methyltransferase RlmH [Casimicrobiaceae bacterium]